MPLLINVNSPSFNATYGEGHELMDHKTDNQFVNFDAQASLKNQKVALLVALRGALALWFLMNFGTFRR